jgi:hypothetical protein
MKKVFCKIYFLLCFILIGCTNIIETADLPGLYNKAASHQGVELNPVIVIPGIFWAQNCLIWKQEKLHGGLFLESI